MLWIAAAVIAVSPSDSAPRTPSAATVQARASVRIISGTRVRFEGVRGDLPRLRRAHIRTPAGSLTAQLIEFE